ncbi:unnamed protein product [Acanthoscelides obtectus]|uniref:Endonuclease/exonuclease/phosphatase domain-containing protein n=1 Tax=Acanthoscelides obtectus TaxID=200917 RepID=A0A9P0MJ10_ACAOB|nr:unnamed protein product [Acanthoscelides obtectus]CAK1629766.1 hypothetical protein AOBTE_LOCUS5937 [Acanthoscelides obtectus]
MKLGNTISEEFPCTVNSIAERERTKGLADNRREWHAESRLVDRQREREKDRKTKLLYDFLEAYNLSQLIESPTRITKSTSTLTDLLIVGDPDDFISVDTLDVGMSDHCVLTFKINFSKASRYEKFLRYRDYSKFDADLFYNDLHSVNWSFIYTLPDVDSMVDHLEVNLKTLFNRHAPYRQVRVSKPPAPWRTYNLKIMMSEIKLLKNINV